VGKRVGEQEDAYELYTDETKKIEDMAFWMKVRDTIRGVLTRDVFNKILRKTQEAAGISIQDSVEEAIEMVTTTLSLTERQSKGVLQHLFSSNDMTVWGLANAITRQSQDEEDYGEATRLEREGGRLIELPSSEWTRLAA